MLFYQHTQADNQASLCSSVVAIAIVRVTREKASRRRLMPAHTGAAECANGRKLATSTWKFFAAESGRGGMASRQASPKAQAAASNRGGSGYRPALSPNKQGVEMLFGSTRGVVRFSTSTASGANLRGVPIRQCDITQHSHYNSSDSLPTPSYYGSPYKLILSKYMFVCLHVVDISYMNDNGACSG